MRHYGTPAGSSRLCDESEERFRSLVENATVGIYRTTPQGGILMANPTLVRMLGFKDFEELAARNLEEAGFEPNYARRLFRERMEKDGEVRGVEEAWTRQDGSVIFIRESARAIRGEDGTILYYDGIVEDITEKKRAEEALRLTQFSVEHASDAIFWMDPQGRILYVNEAACRSVGRSREELLSLSIPDLDPLVRKDAWGPSWEAVKARGSVVLETQHQTKQGRVFPVEVTANYLEFGGKEYSFSFARDITERKRAEAEHVRLVTAIEQSAEAVVITNTSGEIEYVNPAFTRITGYSREEALGQNPRILKSGKQDPAFYQQLWATILKGKIWHGELINRRKDGSLYTEQMNIAPVRGERGEVTHFIATKQDVTGPQGTGAAICSGTKDGGGGTAGRRSGPRFQQPPYHHQRVRRDSHAAELPQRPAPEPVRRNPDGGRAGRHPDAATSGLQPQAGSGAKSPGFKQRPRQYREDASPADR